jgi:hypothetical protein
MAESLDGRDIDRPVAGGRPAFDFIYAESELKHQVNNVPPRGRLRKSLENMINQLFIQSFSARCGAVLVEVRGLEA